MGRGQGSRNAAAVYELMSLCRSRESVSSVPKQFQASEYEALLEKRFDAVEVGILRYLGVVATDRM